MRRALLAEYAGRAGPVLGQDPAPEAWVVVTTAGFEFVRPTREDTDRRPTFEPHALLGCELRGCSARLS